MKNLLIPIFAAAGVATVTASTSDADVATAVQAAFTEKDKAKKEAAEAQAALATATTALEAANKKVADMEEADAKAKAEAATAAVTALIDGAVTSGRITASQKESFTALATADLASTKAVLAALPARGSLTTTITELTASADGGKVAPLSAAGAMLEVQAKLAGK